jgi:hypothetical protein
MSLINRDVYWRNCEVVELDSGRPQGWNPRLVQSVTVFREYDPHVGHFRPIVVPHTQIFDPFGEVGFHSQQSAHTTATTPSLSLGNNSNPLQIWRRTGEFPQEIRNVVQDTIERERGSRNRYQASARVQRDTESEEETYEVKIKKVKKSCMTDRLTRKRFRERTEAGENIRLNTRDDLPPLRRRRLERNQAREAEGHKIQTIISEPMQVDGHVNMTSANEQFFPRPKPNFKIKHEHLTDKLKILHKVMRKKLNTTTDAEMNIIHDEEFIQHNLNMDQSREFVRVQVRDAVASMQEVSLELMAWSVTEWRSDENKVKAQSMLEGAFDVAINVWHELGALSPEMNLKTWNTIYELDALYNKMLNICYLLNLRSLLTTIGVWNPFMSHANQAWQANGGNNTLKSSTTNNSPQPNGNGFNNNPRNDGDRAQVNNGFNNNPRNDNDRSQEQNGFNNNPDAVRDRPNDNNGFNNNPSTPRPWRSEEPRGRASSGYRKFDDTELKIVNTIKSWPNKFDGTQGNFIQCVQSWMQRTNEDITPTKVLANVEWLLDGEALKWHKLFGTSIKEWDEYVSKLQAYLNRGKSQTEIEADFNDSRHNQKRNEEFVPYFTRLKALANKLTVQPGEEKLYERVKRGLQAEYFTCRITASSLTDLMAKCAEYENNKLSHHRTESSIRTSEPFSWMRDYRQREQEDTFRHAGGQQRDRNRDVAFKKFGDGPSRFNRPFNRRYSSGDNKPGFSGNKMRNYTNKLLEKITLKFNLPSTTVAREVL